MFERPECHIQLSLRELLDTAPTIPPLQPDKIHIWLLSTEVAVRDLERLNSFLSVEERTRAGRFHFERDRGRFIACRGCLRLLAAFYSQTEANSVSFNYSRNGKPSLVDCRLSTETARDQPVSRRVVRQFANEDCLRFNVSHSGEWALIAFSLRGDVGVDVEMMKPDLEFLTLAEAVFSSAEHKALAKRSPETRAALFYEYWSCKEACIKADGRGIEVGLDRFTVIASKEPSWRRVSVAANCGLAQDMRIRIVDVGEDYAAAVAAPFDGWDVVLLKVE